MTLQQLKYIMEIVNQGSMNEAAKKLFISQPSLSNSVKELEKELNIEIFVRTNKGITLSIEGTEFLGYAKQVLEQADLLEQRYTLHKPSKKRFSVSTQHYAFSVNAFVNLIKEYGEEEYEFTIRETKTHEIIEDVKLQRSEIGILYKNAFNEKVMNKFLKENHLVFQPLFTASPHIFVSDKNPLAKRTSVTLEDLEEYPYLSFEQGEYNSFYFSEEILSVVTRKKRIQVSDRATLFNLVIGLNGYTISTGILSEDLNGKHIIAIPLEYKEEIEIGWIASKNYKLSTLGESYIANLKHYMEQLEK